MKFPLTYIRESLPEADHEEFLREGRELERLFEPLARCHPAKDFQMSGVIGTGLGVHGFSELYPA